MRTIKFLAITLVLAGIGCSDSGMLSNLMGGAWSSGSGSGLTVGDVTHRRPVPDNADDSGQPVPLSGTMDARVRNTTDRGADVTIRFLLNDIVVHLARLRVGAHSTTAIVGPELTQLVEFTGTDADGDTLPPAVFVFEAGADNLAIYVITDDGDVEPPQPVNENDNVPEDNVNENENLNLNLNANDNTGGDNVNQNINANTGGDGGGGGPPPAPRDCNANGIPDVDEVVAGSTPDCNSNLVPDACDIAAGTDSDVNSNGLPDQCEDCDGNHTMDVLDRSLGQSADCNGNQVPDWCDIAAGTSLDCQSNGIPDECDLAAGTSEDANSDGLPDECVPPALPKLYAVDRPGTQLYTLDVNTGGATESVNFKEEDVCGARGLAFAPGRGGPLYAVLKVITKPLLDNGHLTTIEPDTGVVRLVGPLTEPVFDIAFDPQGTLYGVLGEGAAYPGEIVSIDPGTGTIHHWDPAILGAGGEAQSIAFNPDTGVLYHTACLCAHPPRAPGVQPAPNTREGGPPCAELRETEMVEAARVSCECRLEMIDLGTGSITPIVSSLIGGPYEALVYEASRSRLLGACRRAHVRSLWAIDPTTGSETFIGETGLEYAVTGMAFVPDGTD